ncbi:hypothetical protein BU17DRAFT_49214 [Hysterangium stoloniferum]|nr:hypothetical protein BU17DRAFT_49214 [Hysterangium stoloniferum]
MSDTIVSLPSHLRLRLTPLVELLPENLSQRLAAYLNDLKAEISHSILLEVSKWARTDAARPQLNARKLDPNDYTVISLLAGTITSPSSKLPPYVPPPSASEQARRSVNNRKAITALLNALFSIAGAGYAGWWASGRTGWRDEWRVLFALTVALVVALSEGVLYLIWESRREARKDESIRRRRLKTGAGKKDHNQDAEVSSEGVVKRDAPGNLRRRQPQHGQE